MPAMCLFETMADNQAHGQVNQAGSKAPGSVAGSRTAFVWRCSSASLMWILRKTCFGDVIYRASVNKLI